ncbi:MAG: transketolase C-terminal domain-containing protein, partial [Bacteroidota bacterium]
KSGPIALRYPRGNALGLPLRKEFQKLEIGKAETLRTGKDVAILAIGNVVPNALQGAEILAKEGIDAEVINMRFVKPIDDAVIKSVASRIDCFITVEDNVVQGGFGSAVLESLSRQGVANVSVKLHGLPDDFVEHGTPSELHQMLKLDPRGIADTVKEFLSSRQSKAALELIRS